MSTAAQGPAQPRSRRAAALGRKPPTRAHGDRAGQRSLLLEEMVAAVAEVGYPHTKIGELARRAGVSRATFYELFSDKEQCFLAAQRELAERMSVEVAGAVAEIDPTHAVQAAVTALVAFADREPRWFSFLTHEAVLAGPRALEERDRLMSDLEDAVERSRERGRQDARVLDMPAKILLEGAVRLLGLRVRRGGDAPGRLPDDLLAWIDCYAVPTGPPRWRELLLDPALVRAPVDPAADALPPRLLSRGTRRAGSQAVKRLQREQIAYAFSETIRSKGYPNVTVADIVDAAGLTRDAFYAHFRDRRQAFEETVRLVFERMVAACAGAFFGSSSAWPERVWEAGMALSGSIESDPSLAHFIFVGAYAPTADIKLVDDLVQGFTMFLEDGYRHRPQTAEVPRFVSEAVICTVLAAITFYIRHDRVDELPGLLPIVTYTILAPFIGTGAARDFVDAKIDAAQSGRADSA